MKIKDCIKGFNQGISKVIPPEQTCKVVLRKIQNIDPPILKGYFEVLQPSKIPQYRVIGTDYYQQVVSVAGGTNGKGHFNEQALASGLMEFVERFSCHKYFYIGNRNVTKISSFNAFENNLFQLEDFYSTSTNKTYVRVLKDKELWDAKIRWYKGYTLRGEKLYLPMNLILYLFNGTNGMASGNSLEEALLHAICEVIERHCLALIEVNKLKTPLIDLSTINSPIAKKLIKKFQSLRYPIFIKDFSLGIGLPVIGIVRKINKNNCIITAGVATTREEALIRALTENSQKEGKSNYKKIYLAKYYFVNDKVISIKDILNIDNKNMRLELEKIEEILNKQNMKIFFINTTDKTLNIPSVVVYIVGAKSFFDWHARRNLLMALVMECLATENYNDARRYINIGKKIDKENYYSYLYNEGVILKRKNYYREAISYFQQVLNKTEIDVLKRHNLVNLGLCYQALNEIDNAIDCYTKVIILFTDYNFEDLAQYYNTILSKERRLFNEAKALYQNLKLVKRHFASTKLRDFKKTFEKYQNDKKTILGYLEKAQTYFVSKQYKEAIREANKVIKLNPIAGKMHNVHLLLGFCYEKLGQYKKAISEFKKAEKINPEESQIIFSLSNCYRNIGQIEHSNKELDKGIFQFKRSQQTATLNRKCNIFPFSAILRNDKVN